MTKEEAKILIKEFKKAHTKYSTENGGYWKRDWKKVLVHMDVIHGYWWWKGHRVADLYKIAKAK